MGRVFEKVDVDRNGKPMFLLKNNDSYNKNLQPSEYLFPTVGSFGDYLIRNSNDVLQFTDGNSTSSLSVKVVNSSTKSRHLIMYNTKLLELFDKETKIFIDDSVNLPLEIGDLRQFLIIMAKKK